MGCKCGITKCLWRIKGVPGVPFNEGYLITAKGELIKLCAGGWDRREVWHKESEIEYYIEEG